MQTMEELNIRRTEIQAILENNLFEQHEEKSLIREAENIDFKLDCIELENIWKEYKSIPKYFKQSKLIYNNYKQKLFEISAKYHMEIEDVVLSCNI